MFFRVSALFHLVPPSQVSFIMPNLQLQGAQFSGWTSIIVVKRYGGKIKVQGKNKAFSFSPLITHSLSRSEFNYKENIYKQSSLLKEIFLKVKNVPFKNFPEGTFDELKTFKSSQKLNA